MDDFFTDSGNSFTEFQSQKYICPKHGEQDGIGIQITIRGENHDYCLECWKESLDAAGVRTVTEIKDQSTST